MVGIVILINSVLIGLQITAELEGTDEYRTLFDIVEYFFVAFYTLELGLRLFAMGLTCFRSGWVKFDAFLVSVSY